MDIRSFFNKGASEQSDVDATVENVVDTKENKPVVIDRNETETTSKKKKPSGRKRKIIIESDEEDNDYTPEVSKVNKQSTPLKKKTKKVLAKKPNEPKLIEISPDDFFNSGIKDSVKKKLQEPNEKNHNSIAKPEVSKVSTPVKPKVSKVSTPAKPKVSTAESDSTSKSTPKVKKGTGWYPGKTRATPSKLGKKKIPIGAPDCLLNQKFVITGVLDSLEREDAADLIRKYGGIVTGSLSKATHYVLAGEDAGPKKLEKAEKFGTNVIDEDALFKLIRQSNPDQKPLECKTKPKPKPAKEVPSGNEVVVISDELWVDKYKPKSISKIVGNATCIKNLQKFLTNWDPEYRNPKALSVMISGPPGIGKSTSAALVANECGYEVLEFNASDVRSKKHIEQFILDAGSNQNIQQFFSATKTVHNEKTVIIMDEVDGMSSGDRGGIGELIQMIKVSRVPIICICNDRANAKIRSLANYCLDLRFRRPTAAQISKMIQPIIDSEGMEIDLNAIQKLAQSVRGDIRQVLNTLQMWRTTSDSLNFDEVKGQLGDSRKDIDINVFDMVQEFFKPKHSVDHYDVLTRLYFMESSILPLFVQEKYLTTTDTNLKTIDDLNAFAEAADCLSLSDIVSTHMMGNQGFSMMPLHCQLSCVLPGQHVSGRGGRGMTSFPLWLGKNSSKRKNSRILSDLKIHMSKVISGDSNAVLCEYIPLLERGLNLPIVQNGKEGATEVIKFMEEYGLDLEDRLSVSQFAEFFMKTPPPKIPTNVKTYFTKTYRALVHGVKTRKRVSPSVSTPEYVEEDDDHIGLAGESDEELAIDDVDDKLIVDKSKKKSKTSKAKITKKSKAKPKSKTTKKQKVK